MSAASQVSEFTCSPGGAIAVGRRRLATLFAILGLLMLAAAVAAWFSGPFFPGLLALAVAALVGVAWRMSHDLRPRTDPISPLHIFNRIKTCSNQGGIQVCHPGATAQFAGGRVHAYGTKAQMLVGNEGQGDGNRNLA